MKLFYKVFFLINFSILTNAMDYKSEDYESEWIKDADEEFETINGGKKCWAQTENKKFVQSAIDLMNSPEHSDKSELKYAFWRISMMEEYCFVFERLLKEFNMNPDFSDAHLGTILNQAVAVKALNKVELLLKYGANPNFRENTVVSKRSPLEYALENVSANNYNTAIEIVKLLLKYGTDQYARNNDGQNAIDIARMRGLEEIATLMEETQVSQVD